MVEFIKADLHSHLATVEPAYSFEKLVKAMNKRDAKNGLLGIIEMSHVNHDTRYSDMKKSAHRCGYKFKDLGNVFRLHGYHETFVHGLEIPTRYGHFLAVGTKEGVRVPEGMEPEDAVKKVCDDSGYRPAFIVPHMASRNGMLEYLTMNHNFLEDVDGIEVWNGSAVVPIINGNILSGDANRIAQEFFDEYASDYDFGAVISSDGHSLREVFSSYMIMPTPELLDEASFAKSLAHSIRGSDFGGEKHASYIRAIDHAIKMAGIIALSKMAWSA